MSIAIRLRRYWVFLTILITSCGGSSGTPAAPQASKPTPEITISASPSPVRAIPSGGDATSVSFSFQVNLTFRESAGTSAQITKLVGRLVTDGSEGPRVTADFSLGLPASGSVTEPIVFQFSLTELPTTLAFRISAEGIDESGRSFTVTAVDVPVTLPPPPPAPAADVLLFGGPDHETFLGCFTCSRFDSDSVHNPFGQFGSRFSSTSIWNHFSDFGSRFSNDSACNQFASNPPILVSQNRTFFGELTVNTFRVDAITNVDVQNWLRNAVCEL